MIRNNGVCGIAHYWMNQFSRSQLCADRLQRWQSGKFKINLVVCFYLSPTPWITVRPLLRWFVMFFTPSNTHHTTQGNIGPGAKLEDGKGTAASGALAFFFKTVPLCNRKKYKVTCTARSGANSAMKMFQKRDELGTSDMSTKLNTTHQNQVSEVYLFLLWANLLGTGTELETILTRWGTTLETKRRQELSRL